MMKIAFLMQCHKNPEQINLLLKALKHPQVDVYVHVDSKSENIREDIEKINGVYLLPKKDCVDVQWAQFSQVQATLNLLNAAISGGGVQTFGCNIELDVIEDATPSVSQHTGETTVYVDRSNKKYHSKPNCSGMKNPKSIPLSQAKKKYTACKKCCK